MVEMNARSSPWRRKPHHCPRRSLLYKSDAYIKRSMLARDMDSRDADTSLCGSVSSTKMPNPGVLETPEQDRCTISTVVDLIG